MVDVPLDQLGRRLTTTEAVGALVDVGRSLATLHAEGRGHGSAGRLTVTPDGRVRLGEDAVGGDPKADVLDLGHAVEVRLGHDVPDLLRRLLATCRCPDPAGRPTAEELVALALRIAPPTPVRLPRAHQRAPGLVAVCVGIAALLAAVALGRGLGHGSTRPTALPATVASPVGSPTVTYRPAPTSPSAALPTLTPRPAPASWKAVLVAHDRARQQVWAIGRGGPLAVADVPRSPAERHDVGLLRGLRAADVVARGWRSRIDRVTVLSRTSLRATLRVRDRLAAYSLVASDGTVRHRASARGPRWWLVELRRVDGAWLTWSIKPARVA